MPAESRQVRCHTIGERPKIILKYLKLYIEIVVFRRYPERCLRGKCLDSFPAPGDDRRYSVDRS